VVRKWSEHKWALNLIMANHKADLASPVASAMSAPPSEGPASNHHVRLRHLIVPGYWRRGGRMESLGKWLEGWKGIWSCCIKSHRPILLPPLRDPVEALDDSAITCVAIGAIIPFLILSSLHLFYRVSQLLKIAVEFLAIIPSLPPPVQSPPFVLAITTDERRYSHLAKL